MKNLENSVRFFDFRSAILDAVANAPVVEMSESGESLLQTLENLKYLEKQEGITEDKLILQDEEMSGDIIIEDPHAYPILVNQALNLIYPFIPKKTREGWCRESIQHEMDHAAAAGMLGKAVNYGVRIVRVRDNRGSRNVMSCFIKLLDNKVSRHELSFITSAPEKIGETDQHVLKALGNSALG